MSRNCGNNVRDVIIKITKILIIKNLNYENLTQSKNSSALETLRNLKAKYGNSWNAINSENAARIVTKKRFKTGLDIAKYTATIMRKDIAECDADSSNYWQSLGCWHGFVAQQKNDCCKKTS
jgi:isocitrate lyase